MNDSAEQRPADDTRTVFVTGATGYVGGRLAPRLLAAGWRVRCLTRSARKLRSRAWTNDPRVEIVEGAVEDDAVIAEGMRGCEVAFYLVHSMMTAGSAYAERDERLARAFSAAATKAGVERIIYLGGLGETGDDLSEHLASRRSVESALGEGDAAVTVLRAAMIIGSGSASFEILRYLVERLPIMVTPRWVRTESQPIGIDDVLGCLLRCAEDPTTAGRVYGIGGAEVLNYREIMRVLAKALDLPRRVVIPVPVLTPRLSALWIHLVTPVSRRIAMPLADGLRNRVVCDGNDAGMLLGRPPLTTREAIERAVRQVSVADVETSWTDAGLVPGDPSWAGGTVFTDRRELVVDAAPASVFDAVCRVGGGQGYYAADVLWRLRGALDRLVGGPGLRRGRRHPEHIAYGDALDFWRVVDVEPERRLTLRAEMKLPGQATLAFELEPHGASKTRLVQTARFAPRGLFGLAYWYAVLPLHAVVFRGMLRGIAKAAVAASAREGRDGPDEGVTSSGNRPATP